MRSEYLKAMKEMGIKVEKHHHEVAPSQHELGMYFGTLVDQADNLQLYKYACLLYTSPSPRDRTRSRMPSSA